MTATTVDPTEREANLRAKIHARDETIREKNDIIAEKDAEIERLRAQLHTAGLYGPAESVLPPAEIAQAEPRSSPPDDIDDGSWLLTFALGAASGAVVGVIATLLVQQLW